MPLSIEDARSLMAKPRIAVLVKTVAWLTDFRLLSFLFAVFSVLLIREREIIFLSLRAGKASTTEGKVADVTPFDSFKRLCVISYNLPSSFKQSLTA